MTVQTKRAVINGSNKSPDRKDLILFVLGTFIVTIFYFCYDYFIYCLLEFLMKKFYNHLYPQFLVSQAKSSAVTGLNADLASVRNVGFPEGTTDEQVLEFFDSNGLESTMSKKLKEGDWVCILPLAFSTSVCVGVTQTECFTYRWCFNDVQTAIDFFLEIQELDEIPTDKQKEHLVGHRYVRKPLYMAYDAYGFQKW